MRRNLDGLRQLGAQLEHLGAACLNLVRQRAALDLQLLKVDEVQPVCGRGQELKRVQG
jgi:hypothetical protein